MYWLIDCLNMTQLTWDSASRSNAEDICNVSCTFFLGVTSPWIITVGSYFAVCLKVTSGWIPLFCSQSPLLAGPIWERVCLALWTRGCLMDYPPVAVPTKKEAIPRTESEWPSSLFYSDLTIKSVGANCVSIIQPSYKFTWTCQKSRERWLCREVSELFTHTTITLKMKAI